MSEEKKEELQKIFDELIFNIDHENYYEFSKKRRRN